MSDDPVSSLSAFVPTPDDPRIQLAMPLQGRAKMAALWAYAERLTKLLDEAREPMIGQIKLAWWRDMMKLVAERPDNLPKGEPLLAELQQHWAGEAGLDALVDQAEIMLLAENEDEKREAAKHFGMQLFRLSALCLGRDQVDPKAGVVWGLLWAAFLYRGDELASKFIEVAAGIARISAREFRKSEKSLLMMERLSEKIAAEKGARNFRAEGLILLRISIFGR